MLVVLSSCSTFGASQGASEVEICQEIPFIDAPEGACTNTVTHKSNLVNAETWAKERPYYLMIHVKHWTKIKTDWLKGCRMLISDGQKCNVAVESIGNAIKKGDALIKSLSK